MNAIPDRVQGAVPASVQSVESIIELDVPRDEVFAFFSDARNLNRMTPPWLKFHIKSPQPIEMKLGTEIDYSMRWRGLPVPWRSRVTVWQPPHVFTYVQARGPYRYWLHEHRYEERADGGTRVIDRVDFVGWGQSVMGWFLRREVEAILRHREGVCPGLFESG